MKKRRLSQLSEEERRLIQEDARRHIAPSELAGAYETTKQAIAGVLSQAVPPIEMPPVRPLSPPPRRRTRTHRMEEDQ